VADNLFHGAVIFVLTDHLVDFYLYKATSIPKEDTVILYFSIYVCHLV
jgi:hypothetical protein